MRLRISALIIFFVGVVCVPVAFVQAQSSWQQIHTEVKTTPDYGECPDYQYFDLDAKECVEKCSDELDLYWDKEKERCESVFADDVTAEQSAVLEDLYAQTDDLRNSIDELGAAGAVELLVKRVEGAVNWFATGVTNILRVVSKWFPESSFEIKETSPAGGVRG